MCKKLAYFGMELSMERLVLINDCGSDVLEKVKKRHSGLELLCLSLSEYSCAISYEMSYHNGVCGTLFVEPQVLQKQVFIDGVQKGSVEKVALGG